MDLKEIKKIIEIMKENEITEFELEKDGLRIVLKKGTKNGFKEIPVEYIAPSQSMQTTPQVASQEPEEPKGNYDYIKSPMVGTFYCAPSPDSSPFIANGQSVNSDDVVCIVEAMKVMNEIKADVKGKIVEILVENSEPVEFGQPLFKVEKVK
ncbi:MAG: acetyl-CoA carboxylase biotin carboxyl carrier protein [Candidatus Ancaeobacter aquaticus]|nr:acetyl-CoA carboxylase biotin carboxyl carrier protein [Candidatus Ancaeobacter aquaticus]